MDIAESGAGATWPPIEQAVPSQGAEGSVVQRVLWTAPVHLYLVHLESSQGSSSTGRGTSSSSSGTTAIVLSTNAILDTTLTRGTLVPATAPRSCTCFVRPTLNLIVLHGEHILASAV